MAVDPSISLQVRPPVFADPLEQQGKLLNLVAARNQIALAPIQQQAAQEQLRASQLENQQRNQALADDTAGRQLFSGIQTGGAMPSDSEILGRLGPAHGAGVIKSLREADKAHADLQKTRGEVAAQEQDYAGGLASMVKAAGYTPDAVELAIQHAHHAGYEQQAQQLQQVLQADPTQIKPLMDRLISQSPAQQKLINEADTAASRKSQAATAAKRLELETPGIQTGNLTKGLQVAGQTIAGVQDQAGYDQWRQDNPEAAKRLPPVFNSMVPALAQHLGMTADQQVTTGLTAARNQATAANEQAMRRIAEGNLNVSKQHADIAQKIYQQTYGEGANPALVGVLPAQRNGALSEATKASTEFGKAMDSIHNVQTFIDLAKAGNKAAGSNLPIMGAESIQALNGIRRINRTEIEQYQGAGSLLDRIQGRIGKLATGQPIPADVMADIESLHKAIGSNATETYNRRLEGINQNYHSQFKPVGGSKPSGTGDLKGMSTDDLLKMLQGK